MNNKNELKIEKKVIISEKRLQNECDHFFYLIKNSQHYLFSQNSIINNDTIKYCKEYEKYYNKNLRDINIETKYIIRKEENE